MIGEIITQLIRFILLIFVQVLVLNQIEISGELNGFIIPNLYVLFLLMLPVNINKILLLFICFLTGLTVDIFGGTAGMHASACLVLGFFRPGFLHLIAPREGYETTLKLNMAGMGGSTFLIYASTLILIHHLVLFLVEAFTFLNFFELLLRVITCSISTLLLTVLSQFLTQRNREVAK
ncbi:MAG TPA: rod shape-determining protein MreD [Flavobacteriales bacterium]|jgi:rod shape-determining protein MreD|nr:rod shape-determining protein MreD [Flavobacteriales bacterium]HPH81686.1 rod shape-determining protein MreD [Flavobacteriales bacterium]